MKFDRKSADFEKARQLSKFKDAKPAFGAVNKGHIMLQDHGDVVYFKNVKIKAL
ncbi:family 16 glycoside hydrolase [Olivibacter ginsenosidimutans]|uniref:family 16 glycoside hydrolase n=1 Tax=Olivibacter ginsenosidimutans TaxID=1176537 RepID=UPI0031F06BD0